ncbi:MAG: 2Fe-2S iron-sulfur cluster binding domain-containing protein [Deltaproteobacteria bacterium]|nr:2Fe-2S iron-sulfur cluster binding domain-containing protein [Deltaproteobacteria bacterium]
MRQEILQQFEGYDKIKQEVDISRKFGDDFSLNKGQVAECIARLHPTQIQLQVSQIIEETFSTKTFRLTSVNGYLPPFQAGQYLSISVEVDNVRTGRAYSISSPPNQTGYYDITVRRVENGRVSNFLMDQVRVGDLLESSGPQGTFHYHPILHGDELVCLAGGCGITPFMSMIREIADRGLQRTIHLFYGNPSLHDVIFHQELTRLSKQLSTFNYHPVIEAPGPDYQGQTGYITAEAIKETLGGMSGKSFFICGPQAMYNFCLPELHKLGINQRKIKREMFGTPINISQYRGWPPEVKEQDRFTLRVNGSKSFESHAGQSLLVALEDNGIVVPSICRAGECSQCRIKLVSGKVFQPEGTPVRKSDTKYGYIHSCVSYPLQDLEILL